MMIFHCTNVRMNYKPNFIPNSWHLDELKVSWDDNFCKIVHDKCNLKVCHNGIKHHMTVIQYESVEFEK